MRSVLGSAGPGSARCCSRSGSVTGPLRSKRSLRRVDSGAGLGGEQLAAAPRAPCFGFKLACLVTVLLCQWPGDAQWCRPGARARPRRRGLGTHLAACML